MNKTIEQRALWWISNGETGISSKTIWSVMMRTAEPHSKDAWGRYRYPLDPSDFRRCRLLLDLIPEWRERLQEVADMFPTWQGLVDNWGELDALYDEEAAQNNAPKLYKRMQDLHKYA